MLVHTLLRRLFQAVMACSLLAAGVYGQTPDFSVSISTRGPYVPDAPGEFPVVVTALNGFNSVVSLTCSGPAGAGCLVVPATVTGSGTTAAYLHLLNFQAGSYSVTVQATSGTLQRSASTSFNVVDFTVSMTPSSRTVLAGARTTFTATLTPLGGFNSEVQLSCISTVDCNVTPARLTSGSATVNLSVWIGQEPGTYDVRILAVGPSRVRVATASIVVQSFSLSASGLVASVRPGGIAQFGVNVSTPAGFPSPAALSCSSLPPGWSCSFSPNPVLGPSTLVITTSSSSANGSYQVEITAQAAGIAKTVAVSVAVRAPDFTLGILPQTLAVTPGERAEYSVLVTPLFGFEGTIAFSCIQLPARAACSFDPNPSPGPSRLIVSTSHGTPQGTTRFVVQGTTASGTRTTTADIQVRNTEGTFSMRATPTARVVAAGDWTTFQIDLAAEGGFRGVIRLSCSQLPATARCEFAENPAGVGSVQLAVLTTAATPLGAASIQLSGDNGTVIRTLPLQVTVVRPVLSVSAGIVDTTGCPEIQFPVFVTSGSGEALTTLTNANFTLREDGEPRAMTATAAAGGYVIRYRTADTVVGHNVTLAVTHGAQTGTVTMQVNPCGCAIPSEPSLVLSLQPGFYIAEVTSAGNAGVWGMEVLAQRGELAGGFNLGGGLQEGGRSPGFGAFYLPNFQSVNFTVSTQSLAAGQSGMPPVCVRLLDGERRQIGTDTCASNFVQFTRNLAAGFYVVEVINSTASPRATYQLGLNATSFSGGVVVGGFIADALTGFGAFYLPDDQGTQEVRIRVLGQPSYGPSGACRLQLRVLDANRNVVRTQ